jgi:diguanylate cyclase (GGDEF)-like protein/PAS domain S-box-containing protein
MTGPLVRPGEGLPASEGADDAQRLRELGERYFWLFEDSPVAKYVCDVEGTVLEVNAALCRMLCMRPDDLVGRTLASFSVDPPLPAAELEPFLRGAVRTYSGIRTYSAADGRPRRAAVTLGAIRDENGAARTIFGELEDLTVHELALSELDRQRHRLEMAIEASNIAVWELDVVSGRVTVQDRPPGAGAFREQNMTYGDFVRTFHPDDRHLLPNIRTLRSHARTELDLELRCGTGLAPVRWVHLRGRAIVGGDSTVLRVAGTTADVTEPRAQRAALALQRDRLELALETAGMMAWELRLGPRPLFSAIHADLLGLQVPSALVVSGAATAPVFGDRVVLADRETVGRSLREGLQPGREELDLEYRWHDDTGTVRWVHTRARAEHDGSSQLVRVTGTTADITHTRREVSGRLRAERILSLTVQASPDGFIGVDDTGVVTDWNPAAEAMFGWFRDEVVGQRLVERIGGIDGGLAELLSGMDSAGMDRAGMDRAGMDRAGMDRAGMDGGGSVGADEASVRGEVEVVTRDGRHFPAEVSIVRSEDDGRPFFPLFVRDLSTRKAYESQLVRNALFDPLTSLPNRALLVDRLNGALRRLSRVPGLLAVAFIDVDRFKHINASLGHRAGDDFLVELARRIRAVLRPSDTVARLGADEFVVLCDALENEREAMALAARLVAALATPFVVQGPEHREIYASVSVGIALSSDAGIDGEAIVRDAGTAMHRAKEQGGGHVEVFDAEARIRSVARFEVESELRRALEQGELCVYYQPVVDLTGRLEKVEALVRWSHPSGRIVLPGDFVPLAEASGLIVQLGDMVLRMACEQVNQWRHEHPALAHLGVAVNISSAQLRSDDAVRNMTAIVEGTGLPFSALILELTESVLMDERTGSVSKLVALRSLGVRLAVDDFGTGYSSLLYLRRYPLDMLKIDRSFVAGLVDNHEDATIVDAVVRLGHSFGLQTVAEGVETAEQLRLLRGLGCDMGQGHFWARPMPPETLLSQLLAEGARQPIQL